MAIDKQLIRECIAGNRKSQRTFYELLGPRMLALCQRYARNNQEAEDMLQDGFIRVFTHLSSFKNDGPIEAWVRRVVVNAALRRVNRKSFSHEEIGIPDYLDRAEDSVAVAQLSEQELLKVIQALPDGYRAVFNMYIIEGYSHKEIAKKLGYGESTSRSQLAKAKRLLQKQLLQIHYPVS